VVDARYCAPMMDEIGRERTYLLQELLKGRNVHACTLHFRGLRGRGCLPSLGGHLYSPILELCYFVLVGEAARGDFVREPIVPVPLVFFPLDTLGAHTVARVTSSPRHPLVGHTSET
jgi:hypothetical protein